MPLLPAEIAPVSESYEPTAIVPPILSTSKQQNQTPVLLLPSQIFPSIAGGNTHASFQEAGELVLCKNEGSLSAENPEINAIRTQLIVSDGILFSIQFFNKH